MRNSKKKLLVFVFLGASAATVVSLGEKSGAPATSKTLSEAQAYLRPVQTSGRPLATTVPVQGHDLRVESTVESDVMTTTKFQDFFHEPSTGAWIEVVGSMSLVHQNEKGRVFSNKLAHWDHSFGRPMSPADATDLAKALFMQSHGTARAPLRIQLKVLPNQERTDAQLVYWVDFEDRLLILDAENGNVVHDISKHRAITAPPKVKVYSAQGLGDRTSKYSGDSDTSDIPQKLLESCQLVSTKEDSEGTPIVINPDRCQLTAENSSVLPAADEDSVRTLANTGIVAQYYSEKHGRSSFDGKGTELISVVHVGDSFDNAYWDEEQSFMAYGDGDGTASGSYTQALDIVGHEMTHGVTAATAKLLGTGEAGALNEAYSDFFGIMISNMRDPNPDWTVGKEISLAAEGKEPGMRSLAMPGKFTLSTFTDKKMTKTAEVPFPSKFSEKLAIGQECNDKNDQCEIHGNATIPGHASYLIAKALELSDEKSQNRYDRAAKLYYTVLTQWLTATDGFAIAAKDTVDACKLMYQAQDCTKVEQAFVATGILGK